MRIPKIFRNSIIYTIISVLQKGIAFLLLPIYTLYLSPADYGILGVSSSITSFLAIFTTLSLGAASTRFYYKRKDDSVYIRKLYGTIVTTVCINSVIVGGVFIIFHKWIVDPIIGTIPFYPFIFLGILNVIVTPLYLYYQEYLRTLQSGFHYGVNSMCQFLIQVGLNIVFIVVFHLGVIGVLTANLITSAIFFLYAFIVFSKRIQWGVNKPILKDGLKYSLPLLPHALANWSNGTIDKLLVNGIKSQADAGLYNLSQQYGSVLSYIVNGVNQAYVPWYFGKVEEGEKGVDIIEKFAEAVVWIIAFTALVMAIFSKEVLGLVIHNPAYSDVWMVVPCVVFAYVFQCLYYFYVNVLFLKDTKDVFKITVSCIVINVLLNLWLIPIIGFIGCGVAFLLTYMAKSVIALIFSKSRNKEIRFRTVSMYGVTILALVCSLMSLVMVNIPIWETIAIKFLLCGLLGAFIYFKYNKLLRATFASWKNRA